MRRARKRKGGAGMFWLGAGAGMLLSAAAVAIAAEFTYLRRRRLLHTGMLDTSEEALVHDLSAAVHHGLEHITHAAKELGHTFAEARRELVRMGLDPTMGQSSSDAGWYFEDDDEPGRSPGPADGPDFDEQWEGADEQAG